VGYGMVLDAFSADAAPFVLVKREEATSELLEMERDNLERREDEEVRWRGRIVVVEAGGAGSVVVWACCELEWFEK